MDQAVMSDEHITGKESREVSSSGMLDQKPSPAHQSEDRRHDHKTPLQTILPDLPSKPGVYRFYDDQDKLLYVGKARRLKTRLSHYVPKAGHSNRLARMIASIKRIEYTLTQTEAEALLLEANLIKRLKPYYNILLRDDKSFPSLLLRRDHPAPQLMKHRGARTHKGDYFGPFASVGAVNHTLNTLQKAFLLRTCRDSVFASRKRPCLLYQIKRCSAPCVDLITQEEYQELVTQTKDFLNGRSNALRLRLQEDMQAAARVLDYEKAAVLRDRLHALASIHTKQDINPKSVREADVFSVYKDSGLSCVQTVFYRAGQNWGGRASFPRHDPHAEEEHILSAFLAQFYDSRPPPPLILVNKVLPEQELLEKALSAHVGYKVKILLPKRGEKKNLTEHALTNAREALGRKLATRETQKHLLAELTKTLNLPTPPQRIEVYDNSHIQGSHAVGAFITAGPEGFEKNQYRLFNIKSEHLTPGDDYAMMREVMQRRFGRLVKEGGIWPDLIIIDGGAGQLKAAEDVLADLDPEGQLTLLAVAKGKDRNAGQHHKQHRQNTRQTFLQPLSGSFFYYIFSFPFVLSIISSYYSFSKLCICLNSVSEGNWEHVGLSGPIIT